MDGLNIEGLEAAVAREQFVRDRSFLPITETIGGLDVMPFTLRHWVALRLIESPFICGGEQTLADVAAFLWTVSPDYSPTNERGKRNMRRWCQRFDFPDAPRIHLPWLMRRWENRALNASVALGEVLKGIQAYLADTFQDSPPSSGHPGPSYYSYAASVIDTLAFEYGWTMEQIMHTPLKVSFQLVKIIRARRRAESGKQPVLFNPSDKLKSEALEKLNRN